MMACPNCDEKKYIKTTVRERRHESIGSAVAVATDEEWRHECKRCGTTWEGQPGEEPTHVQRSRALPHHA